MSNRCVRCLNRIPTLKDTARRATLIPPVGSPSCHNFSTTTPLHRVPASQTKKPGIQLPKQPGRGEKRKQTSKKAKREQGKPLGEGERREFRKRIVLSNTNALDVPSLTMWNSRNVGDAKLEGSMVALEGETIDKLRAIGAFQAKQGWSYFKRPSCIVRPVTTQLYSLLDEVERSVKGDKQGKTGRILLTGERGSGKSVALLQAMAMAFMKNWVVIHIPEAQDLVLGNTHYAPLSTPSPSNPTTYNPSLPLYVQKDYTAKLLATIVKANAKVLRNMSLTLNHSGLPIPIRANISLDNLAELGANDADIAWPIFNALWQELTSTQVVDGKRRPPILLSVEGLSHICRPSQYIAPNMHFIHAHDLALVQHFMQYLSGQSLPNGGLVLAVDTVGNRPLNRAVDLAVRQAIEHKQPFINANPLDLPPHDPQNPYTPIDERSISALRAAGVLTMERLSRDEAREVLEYYARSGMWRSPVNERTVGDTWTLAGHGVIGELERVTVRTGLA